MKKLILYIFLVVLTVPVFSQSTNISTFFMGSTNKADELYSMKAYRNALEVYLRVAEKDGGSEYTKTQIAECFLELNDPASAEFWLQSLAKAPDVDPKIKFKYARVLCMNKKYKEALHIFKELDKTKFPGPYLEEQIKFIENLSFYMADSLIYTIGNVPALNSPYSEFGATYFKHNKVVFASTRDADQFIKYRSLASSTEEESMTNLYESEYDVAANFGHVSFFKRDDLKTTFHDGPIVFYDNYRKAAFTRSNAKNRKGLADATGNVNVRLYLADVGVFGLRNIKPFKFNNDGISVGHATFSKDGNTMYFASTNPTGLGGSDIYVSTFERGEWTEPVNLGSAINTPGDELYPFLENDNLLFFASNGRGGLGGLDIYLSHRRNGEFRPAMNCGYPLNSSHDDFSLTVDSTGRLGFFASNRPGGEGNEDIYRFIAKKFSLQGITRDRNNPTVIVPHTKILIKDEEGNLLDSARSDLNGNFKIGLPFEKDISITAEKQGYDILEDIGFSTQGLSFSIDSLLIPMWKHSLFAKGRIFSNETQGLLPGAVVLRRNLTTNQTDTVVVSEDGAYAFLVLPNNNYRIESTKEGYIANGFDLNTHDLYDGDLLNDIVLEEVYIEKSEPLFDLNKSNIRPEAYPSLDRVMRTLKKYPGTTLNIGAHADSRGTREYNKKLSARRAETVVQYFIGKGVSRNRIEAHAFGEELILNRCSDGVICSEEDHSLNRRVEIKVQNKPIE
ncbi:MAG TPA: OmpA family protein [Cyclobacteriaceae bacterium]|nr:OmpA family protein [Cyclobacteriaceae bacterium]